MKTVTIYLKKRQQQKIKDKVARVLASYDGFVLAEADESQIDALRKEKFKFAVRDEIDTIHIGDAVIDTRKARYNNRGVIRKHKAYRHTRDPGAQSHHYIVQFIGPIKEEWKTKIKKIGGIICDPLPSYAFVVEMDSRIRNAVIQLPFVRWVGHYDPAYRLAPRAGHQVFDIKPEVSVKKSPALEKKQPFPLFRKPAMVMPFAFAVSFHTRDNLDQALEGMQKLGFILEAPSKSGKSLTVRLPQNTSQVDKKLNQLAALHGVRSIEPLLIKQLRNDVATRIMTGTLNEPVQNLPYTGKKEIIAVADTGLDTGDPATLHEDFRGRIAGIRSWPIKPLFSSYIHNPGGNDGPVDLDSGHGTHVAGSALGDGTRAARNGLPAIRGLAHGAKLFFQALEQKLEWILDDYRFYYGDYLLAGLPDDITELFQQAYDAGARIHNNSWGGGDFGAYNADAVAVDRFVWENKDMIILYAASNDGEDRDSDGVVNPLSITPPGTAKNCITVGASENLRPSIAESYKNGWPDDFPREPLASDMIADDISDVAAFSSRGPCLDKRFKPDVVAPGTFILSTKSSRASGVGWGLFNDDYFYLGGTSMATPLTAGAVTLFREYLRRKRRRMPSAALVKAVLIHNAVRRNYRHGATHPPEIQWDYEQGWGHVNLGSLIAPPENQAFQYKDISRGLYTGESRTYYFSIGSASRPVKATLAWTDYPAGVNQYPSLVNNLNLIVTAPDGSDYHGNVFASPYDQNLDSNNNVETVVIDNPKPGRYKIRVIASDVKEGPQHFGLVYSGNIR